MQTSSAAFDTAMDGAEVTWAPARAMVDWFGDGYATSVDCPWLRIYDSFTRTDAPGLGWSPSDTGHAWTIVAGSASEMTTNGIQGAVTPTAVNVNKFMTIGPNVLDSHQLVTINLNVYPSGGVIIAALVSRFVDASNFYRANLQYQTDQTLQLQVIRKASNVDTILGTVNPVSTLSNKPGRKYKLRFETTGGTTNTVVSAKLWAADQDEPTDWTISASDSSPLLTPAPGGIRVNFASGLTNPLPVSVYFDDYISVCPDLDDLTQAIGSFSVAHALDDGLPNDVTLIDAVGTPEVSTPLRWGRLNQPASQFYSPYRVDAPLATVARDVSAAKLDIRAVTTNGIESVRVFTGQTADTPLKGTEATLEAISAARLRLSKLVQPPAVHGPRLGAEATWLVHWIFAQCGFYASPQPRAGCRSWVPMHGSIFPFIPNRNIVLGGWNTGDWNMQASPAAVGAYSEVAFQNAATFYPTEPTFIDGPFLRALFCRATATDSLNLGAVALSLDPGASIMAQDGNVGRVEFWYRADSTSNATPAGTANINVWSGVTIQNDTTQGQGLVQCGIGVTDRKPFIKASDGTHTYTFKASSAIPSDGSWRFFGAAWSWVNDKLWLNDNGTITSTAGVTLTDSALPVTEAFSNVSPWLESWIPIAEFQLTAGTDANPDTTPLWLNSNGYFTATTNMRNSHFVLVSVIEAAPREAWELLGSLAQAELAMTRIDENDMPHYLPYSYWVETAQQTVVDALSTTVNVDMVPAVRQDPSRIRNQVSISYKDTLVSAFLVSIAQLRQIVTLPPGTTILRLGTLGLVANAQPWTIIDLDPPSVAVATDNTPYLFASDSIDGNGSYAFDFQVFARVTDFDAGSVEITIFNQTAVTWYLTHNITSGVPFLNIPGNIAVQSDNTASSTDSDSVALRGERSLTVQAPQIQSQFYATRLAERLRRQLANPQPWLSDLRVLGDPRRQPGDLVTFDDARNTGLGGGVWRVVKVIHTGDAASYIQTVGIRQVKQTGKWGDGVSKWGSILWK